MNPGVKRRSWCLYHDAGAGSPRGRSVSDREHRPSGPLPRPRTLYEKHKSRQWVVSASEGGGPKGGAFRGGPSLNRGCQRPRPRRSLRRPSARVPASAPGGQGRGSHPTDAGVSARVPGGWAADGEGRGQAEKGEEGRAASPAEEEGGAGWRRGGARRRGSQVSGGGGGCWEEDD